nr:hypothetical protein [Tanacetum cinerariifolium]
MDQNIDSSSFDQIQTPQYPIIHPPSQEMSEEVFQAKGHLMKSLYDDEEYSIQYKEYLEKSPDAIAPILPTEEHEYSLSTGEYEDTFDDESECNVPVKDESSSVFTTFSNPLFDDNDDFTSSDDESLPEEDVPIEEFKEFFGELVHINPILPGIKEADFDLEEEIRFVENLLYDNSSPRPPEELNAKIADTIVESLSPSPIPVEDSDSLMDEIDLFLAMDDLLPPSIESDGYDSEGDIHFFEEMLIDNYISILENESSDFYHQDDPSFPRPPSEPPDAEFYFDFEPNDELNEDNCFDPGGKINVFTDVEDNDYFPFIFVIRIFLSYLIYPEVSPLLLSAGSEDTIFDPGISV